MSGVPSTSKPTPEQRINEVICRVWAELLLKKIAATTDKEQLQAIGLRLEALKQFARECGLYDG